MEYVLSIIGIPGTAKRVLAPFRDFCCIYMIMLSLMRAIIIIRIFWAIAPGVIVRLLITVKIFTLSMLSAGPILPAYSSAITIENIISLTNQSRQEYKLGTLRENSLLNAAAQTKANDMLKIAIFLIILGR